MTRRKRRRRKRRKRKRRKRKEDKEEGDKEEGDEEEGDEEEEEEGEEEEGDEEEGDEERTRGGAKLQKKLQQRRNNKRGPKQHNPTSFRKAADEGIDAAGLLGALNPGQISIF
jgi:hypothetical protein